jgi:monolysocardiolipin acyltransferase
MTPNHQLTAGGRLFSTFVIGAVGLACKAFLNLGFCGSVRVKGLEILREALENEEEAVKGKGLVTGMYHQGVLVCF